MKTVDVLAIAAHRDDVELTCAGTLIKSVTQGKKVGIIDLTAGEMGTRGSAEIRGQEAESAAQIMGVTVRQNLGLPDTGVVNAPETRVKLAVLIRQLRPTIVIAPAQNGRHPDHRAAVDLIRDACFIAGIQKVEPSVPTHRPKQIIHAIAYREDYQKPTFVVDITDEFETKLKAISAYESQFRGVTQAGEIFPNGEPLLEIVRHQAAHYGSLIRAKYGEPFYTPETMRIDDLNSLQVSSF